LVSAVTTAPIMTQTTTLAINRATASTFHGFSESRLVLVRHGKDIG
jgi:hypothetical protein